VGGIITSLLNNNNLTFLDLDTPPPLNNTTPPPKKKVFVKAQGAVCTVQSPTHLQVFRDATVQNFFPGRVTSACPMNTAIASLRDAASPRIGILNRQKTRRIESVDVLACELGQAFPVSSLRIKEFESASFADQVDFCSSIDILISAHGAQLTGTPFMPNCGGLVELTPKGCHIPEFFGSLAVGSGLQHGSVHMSGGDAINETKAMSRSLKSRTQARSVNLCPPSENIVDAVRVLIDGWHQCCNRAAAV
jgi:hypothetical protein